MIDCIEKSQQNHHHQRQQHQLLMINTSANDLVHQPNPPSYLSSVCSSQQQPSTGDVPTAGNQHQSGNELIGYYFGSISRETAEWILKTHGNQMDGAYLLRSSGPNDDFVLSLMVVVPPSQSGQQMSLAQQHQQEVLHYKIVETEDSFVALHGQVGDEKFATIDELIDKAQGVATKPRWPILRQTLESQILPPTYWGLTVDQVRLAILMKAKQWGFPLLSSLFQQQQQLLQDQSVLPTPFTDATTLNNETIRTLIYKSLHEFQPWFHGKIGREEAERRIEEKSTRDGRFLVRERDNYSYAMCISHKKTTKHYRIDVLPTGELAIQDGRKFTSLMALVSHYTIMSDGLWCALTLACPRPIHQQVNGKFQPGNACGESSFGAINLQAPAASSQTNRPAATNQYHAASGANMINQQQNLYSGVAPMNQASGGHSMILQPPGSCNQLSSGAENRTKSIPHQGIQQQQQQISADSGVRSLVCAHQGGVASIKGPIREWLQTINHKWSQLMATKNQHHQSVNSFLFGNQNPLNNHCKRNHRDHHHHHHYQNRAAGQNQHKRCKNGHTSCGCIQQLISAQRQPLANNNGINTGNNVQQFGCCGQAPAAVNTGCQLVRANPLMSNGINLLQQGANQFNSRSDGTTSQSGAPLLSNLAQNSGFNMNSQSFIGSPLFAVNQQLHQQREATSFAGTGALSVSGSSDSQTSQVAANTNNPAGEGKLISPVQSISTNLSANNNNNNTNSNPYQTNQDIYGSEVASTALVNDRHNQVPPGVSNSSSSGSRNNNLPGQMQYKMTASGNKSDSTTIASSAFQAPVQYAGPILCGHHAGPAYRYTNCGPNDENTFNQCFHRPAAAINGQAPYGRRAADDSQLITSGTSLMAPAAMAKFVQFQDGQCLRTHRDTRSIQMAYLSSRQATNMGFAGAPKQRQVNTAAQNNQAPLRELNGQRQQQLRDPKQSTMNQQQSLFHSGKNNDFNKVTDTILQRQRQRLNNIGQPIVGSQLDNLLPTSGDGDIDLIDCNTDHDDDGFDNFKCDPKLIKSSSIETLCGIGEEEEEEVRVDMANFKSNTELIMSQLQSCWMTNQRPTAVGQHEILSPVQANQFQPLTNPINPNPPMPVQMMNSNHNMNEYHDGKSLILNSFAGAHNTNEAQHGLEHLKKKHDLDELTTNLLAELTASLKAQVDLKNKRSGLAGCLVSTNLNQTANDNIHQTYSMQHQQQHMTASYQEQQPAREVNPLELINEFDTLMPNNNKN